MRPFVRNNASVRANFTYQPDLRETETGEVRARCHPGPLAIAERTSIFEAQRSNGASYPYSHSGYYRRPQQIAI